MEEKKIQRTHKVGTVTFGLILVLMGTLMLLRLVLPALDYELIFHLWPVIFIVLGAEVLVSSFKPEEPIAYDGAAIFLLLLLIFFAMGMACVEWGLTNAPFYLEF